MNKFLNAKIYKIVCNTTGLQYIGSTCEELSRRLTFHKADYKRYINKTHNYITSFKIIENNNYEIILIENYPCNCKEELFLKEGFHIKNNECVNRVISGRSKKEYIKDNKNKIKDYSKNYYKKNSDKIKERQKEYYKNKIKKIVS